MEIFTMELPLIEGYTIAYETVDTSPNAFLRLECENGLFGWGCATPDQIITGETLAQVEKCSRETIFPMLYGRSPFEYHLIIEQLRQALPGMSSTYAMVDMALYDLMARKAGEPLYKLLGGYRKSIATSITIGILPAADTLKQARRFMKDGFNILKIKGGLNVEEDIYKMLLIKQTFGSNVTLRFDANQGYTVEEALHFLKATLKAEIELFEQPSCHTSDVEMGMIRRSTHVPVMADESLRNLADVFRLASNQLTDMMNIKLMKVGGITESLHINSVAKSAGLECMVGCFDESALGISAGLHFALSRSNIRYADLDGHLDLASDPFRGMFHLKNGELYPSEAFGLGPVPKSI